MRKYIKNQLQDMIETLKQANVQLCDLLERQALREANMLLAEEQRAALRIGEEIEKCEGEESKTVRLLEEYCELLWQCSQSSEKDYIHLISEALSQSLTKISDSLWNDIKTQYEIVFLPYKASMWDSLESVWLAAKQDEDCECYVMPIPYYNRNADQSFGEMSCDAGLFPDYVPITSYTEYNLQAHHPEAIFFHNPYDEHNYVTSVHPAFYSSELRKYTDMLVYIPYYVSMDCSSEKHCTDAGVVNAHRVFVQSDEVRQTFLRVLKEELHITDEQAEKIGLYHKITAIGSPKIDKVLNRKREDLSIPKEWREKIDRSEGAEEKKVFLVNTHLHNLMSSPEKFIEYMKNLRALFYKNKARAVMLWRPHPLSKDTILAVRPEIYEKYLRMEEEFKRLPNGIYDTSSDLDRALTVSDAYLGDHSSLVPLYGVTGKSMMIMLPRDQVSIMRSVVGAYYRGAIYFSALHMNGLFKLTLDTGKIEQIGIFEKEQEDTDLLHQFAWVYKTYCWFMPRNAKNIAKVDLETLSISYIPLPKDRKYDRVLEGQFTCSAVRDHMAWLFPGYGSMVMSLNLETEEIKIFDQWPETDEVINWAFYNGVVCESSVWMFGGSNSHIVKLDPHTGVMTLYRPEFYEEGYAGAAYDGTNFWIEPVSDKPIVKCNTDLEIIAEIGGYPEGFKKAKRNFSCIYCYREKIWLSPFHANMLLCIDIDENCINEVKVMDRADFAASVEVSGYFTHTIIEADEKIFFPSAIAYKLTGVDTERGNVLEYDMEVSKDYLCACGNESWKNVKKDKKLIRQKHLISQFLYDDGVLPVESFIDMIFTGSDQMGDVRKEYFGEIVGAIDGTCGLAIWKDIREEIV